MTTPLTTTSSTPTNSTASSSTTSASSTTDALGNEQTFLQLLVAQIQNQDPLNPTDSTTFITQLAQFSELEQLININQSVGQIDVAVGGSTNLQPSSSGTAASSGNDVSAANGTPRGTGSPSASS
jgi:flagellar basal-body rod modification protein FlgD